MVWTKQYLDRTDLEDKQVWRACRRAWMCIVDNFGESSPQWLDGDGGLEIICKFLVLAAYINTLFF